MIAIIDYGMGNLRSVQKGLERVGYPATIATTPEELRPAQGIVLPGVGSFGDTMANLRSRGFDVAIRRAIEEEKPFLGICVGLQVLFDYGEEMGHHEGLGIFPGRVRRFTGNLKIPHMGWNQVILRRECPLLGGIPDRSYFYFVHSYYAETPAHELICATTLYGVEFPCVVARDKIFAVQFHPEKSSTLGLRVLENFGKLVASC